MTTRLALFTPMKVAKGPKNGLSVGEIRVKTGTFTDGQRLRRVDLWTELKDASRHAEAPVDGDNVVHHEG